MNHLALLKEAFYTSKPSERRDILLQLRSGKLADKLDSTNQTLDDIEIKRLVLAIRKRVLSHDKCTT